MDQRTIYIGSIPYDQTEEQILDLASSVGPVQQLRMVFDKETGKSKGYCFIEYRDAETAASAVRNLNNYNIGNRLLKCGYANELTANGTKKNELPPLPNGVDIVDQPAVAVSKVMAQYDRTRQKKLLSELKQMAVQDEALFVHLLEVCPQLSYAFVELVLQNGLYSMEELKAATAPREIEQLDEGKKQLIKQVLQLTPDQLVGLSDEQRSAFEQIKSSAVNGDYGQL